MSPERPSPPGSEPLRDKQADAIRPYTPDGRDLEELSVRELIELRREHFSPSASLFWCGGGWDGLGGTVNRRIRHLIEEKIEASRHAGRVMRGSDTTEESLELIREALHGPDQEEDEEWFPW